MFVYKSITYDIMIEDIQYFQFLEKKKEQEKAQEEMQC